MVMLEEGAAFVLVVISGWERVWVVDLKRPRRGRDEKRSASALRSRRGKKFSEPLTQLELKTEMLPRRLVRTSERAKSTRSACVGGEKELPKGLGSSNDRNAANSPSLKGVQSDPPSGGMPDL